LTIFLALSNPDYLVKDTATVAPQPESAASETVR